MPHVYFRETNRFIFRSGQDIHHKPREFFPNTTTSGLTALKDESMQLLEQACSSLTESQKDKLAQVIDFLIVGLRSRYSDFEANAKFFPDRQFSISSDGLAFYFLQVGITSLSAVNFKPHSMLPLVA